MNRRQILAAILVATLVAPSAGAAFAAGTEKPMAPEISPPGDKYNHITLSVMEARSPLNVAEAKAKLGPDIEKTGRAVAISKITEVKLKAGKAIKIAYDSNSEPNAVTNKQVREENEAFYFAKDGKLVSLQLSAPKGADNVDQWKLISSSFRWN